MAIRVTVWNENIHDRTSPEVQAIYPSGMHAAIAGALQSRLGEQVLVRTATLDEPDAGLPAQVLDSTDVLIWWGHVGHDQVEDRLVDAVQARVLGGMGLIVLHSGHLAKPFRRLMGTSCTLRWRAAADREIVWTVNPQHPIAAGLPEGFQIPGQEMYGEFFDIPVPDELVFISSFSGGEVFRSGCCFQRGKGKIFYFSPGHETFPVYHQREVGQVLANAVGWAYTPRPAPVDTVGCPSQEVGWYARSTAGGCATGASARGPDGEGQSSR